LETIHEPVKTLVLEVVAEATITSKNSILKTYFIAKITITEETIIVEGLEDRIIHDQEEISTLVIQATSIMEVCLEDLTQEVEILILEEGSITTQGTTAQVVSIITIPGTTEVVLTTALEEEEALTTAPEVEALTIILEVEDITQTHK